MANHAIKYNSDGSFIVICFISNTTAEMNIRPNFCPECGEKFSTRNFPREIFADRFKRMLFGERLYHIRKTYELEWKDDHLSLVEIRKNGARIYADSMNVGAFLQMLAEC